MLWSFVSNFERHKLRKVHCTDTPSAIQSTSYQRPCYSGNCLNLDLKHFPDLPAVCWDQQIGTSNTYDSVAVVFVNLWRILI